MCISGLYLMHQGYNKACASYGARLMHRIIHAHDDTYVSSMHAPVAPLAILEAILLVLIE
jgi:hypothetical protein